MRNTLPLQKMLLICATGLAIQSLGCTKPRTTSTETFAAKPAPGQTDSYGAEPPSEAFGKAFPSSQKSRPLRELEPLGQGNKQDGFRVATAQIVWVDYENLFNDFPQIYQDLLRENPLQNAPSATAASQGATSSASGKYPLSETIKNAVDKWLLDSFAYVSFHQALQQENEPVSSAVQLAAAVVPVLRPQYKEVSRDRYDASLPEHTTNFKETRRLLTETAPLWLFLDRKPTYRPKDYGRSFVMEAIWKDQKIGLVDVKGGGRGRTPILGDKTSGIMPLSEAIREVLMQKLIEQILLREFAGETPESQSHTQLQTIRSYAVLSLGTHELFKDGANEPLALYLRQAHGRSSGSDHKGGLADVIFTMTKPKAERLANIFKTYGLTAFEGQYENRLKNLQVSDLGDIFDFGSFGVEPDSAAQSKEKIPFETWGKPENWQFDKPYIYSKETGIAFLREQNRNIPLKHLKDMLTAAGFPNAIAEQ